MAEETSLPKATINQIVNATLASSLSCSSEAREVFLRCCTEFVHFVASEANEISIKTQKKTINSQIVLDAIQSLEMPTALVARARTAHEDCKNELKMKADKKATKRADEASPEELQRLQAALFAKARVNLDRTWAEQEAQQAPATTESAETTDDIGVASMARAAVEGAEDEFD